MLLEKTHACQDPVKRGPAGRVGSVVVLDFGRSVQADADTEVIAPEELRPFGGQTRVALV